MGHITEKNRYAERRLATGGAWDEHFSVVTVVDKDGVPVEAAQQALIDSGADVYWATGTRTGDTTFTFTSPAPIAAVAVTPIDIRAISVRSTVLGSEGLWYEVPMKTVAIAGAAPNWTVTVAGAAFPATCEIRVFIHNDVRAFSTSGNLYSMSEARPNDQKDNTTTVASAVAINNTTLCFPAAAATPTSNWDTFSLNAANGKARRISISGKAILVDTKTAILKIYASDDPNATSASKTWVQKYFYDNDGSVINSKTLTGAAPLGLTQTFLFTLTEFSARYLYLEVVTNDDTTFTSFMSAGY